MATSKIPAHRNPSTGSYTVPMPKSAATGKFVARSKASGRIQVLKASKSSRQGDR